MIDGGSVVEDEDLLLKFVDESMWMLVGGKVGGDWVG